MSIVPTKTLRNGVQIPLLAFGVGTIWNKPRMTFLTGVDRSTEMRGETTDILAAAFRAGFRHIDTAELYETEEEIGIALKEFLAENPALSRKDFFITTKILPHAADPQAAIDASLKKLGIDYVDLYLVHLPFVEQYGTTLAELWPKLEAIHAQGKARALGVSNFTVEHLEHLKTFAKIPPAVNQFEFHPYLQDRSPGIVAYCAANDIAVEAFGPLSAVTTKDYATAPLSPTLDRLAAKYGKSPAQVCLRWVLQNGIITITTSSKKERVAEAFDVFDFELTPEEVAEISEIGKTFTDCKHPLPQSSDDKGPGWTK